MPGIATIIMTIIAGLMAALAAYVYFCGIPPELKRKLQEEALKNIGKNKAGELVDEHLDKIPQTDQEDIKDLKAGISGALGKF